MEKFIPIQHGEDKSRGTKEDGLGTGWHLAWGGRSGCPHGAAVFLGKPLGMALPWWQQKLGKGWHRAENPAGAAAVEAGGRQGNGPSQHISMPQKRQLSTQKGH